MGVPKRRSSKSRKNKRKSHHHLKAPTLSACSECGEPKLPHRACPHCGSYRGKTVIQPKEEE
ncbi:MAG TPA: 50S ribosomal protein L32 [Candidatus Limnocylindrales bacterium]|nr:50S ribosomal protein L32 [Candidatus Limnocylindrales bacterium]